MFTFKKVIKLRAAKEVKAINQQPIGKRLKLDQGWIGHVQRLHHLQQMARARPLGAAGDDRELAATGGACLRRLPAGLQGGCLAGRGRWARNLSPAPPSIMAPQNFG